MAPHRESRITFEKQLRSSFGPRARDSSDLTDSSASEESSRRSTEHDRQLDGMLQSQLNSRAQHNPPESVPATDHSAVPWYRACALRVVSHRDFEFVVMFITIVNCVGLALYSPLQPPTHSCNVWMDTIDRVANICFTVEAVLRIIALGSLAKYLSSVWNAFDFCVVSLGYLSYVNLGRQATGVRALRGFRGLKPLRGMTVFKPLRIVVDCFLQAVPLLASTIGLLLGFIFLTGLTGVQLYSGSFHFACINDVTGELEPWESDVQGFTWGCGGSRSCPANFTCADLLGSVSLSENLAGFDNVGAAMLTAFQVSTVAGWSRIFYRATDNTNSSSLIYFLGIVLFVAYILNNLFLAGLKLKFASASREAFEIVDSEGDQQDSSMFILFKFVHRKMAAFNAQRVTQTASTIDGPEFKFSALHKAQQHLRRFVEHDWFSRVFMGIILINTIAMAMEYDGMSPMVQEHLEKLNTYLTALFVIEVGAKLLALGLTDFMSESFNIFDFCVVGISLVEVAVLVRSGSSRAFTALRSFKTLRILKSFRVLRLLRMFRYMESLRALGEVLLDSVDSFLAVSFLCALFLVVFTILGLHVFGDLVLDIESPNFHGFYQSFLTTFQILTLENWEEVMYSTMRSSGQSSACLFFVTWVLIGKFTLLSLFLAVIMEAFEVAHERQLRERTTSNATALLGMGGTAKDKGLQHAAPVEELDVLRMQLFDVAQRALIPAGASSSDLRQIQEEATPLHSPSNSPRAHPATMASRQVPAFSPGQITAAQSEQQKSMVAYSMMLDGCRISTEQYDVLLECAVATDTPSCAAVSPVVADPARNIAEHQPKDPFTARRDTKPSRSQTGERGVSFAGKPIAESLAEEDSYTGLVVETSLVDVQSSVDFDDAISPAAHNARPTPDRAGRGAAAHPSSRFSALSALQEGQHAFHPNPPYASDPHNTGSPVPVLGLASPRHGGAEFGRRDTAASQVMRAVPGLLVGPLHNLSPTIMGRTKNSRASHLSPEHSREQLCAEEASRDSLALAVGPAPVASAALASAPLGPISVEAAAAMGGTAHSRQLQQAAARRKRRLKMIAAGSGSFGAGAISQSFSHEAAALGCSLSLTHTLSADVMAAALKYNPLFSVMEAAEHAQSQQKDDLLPGGDRHKTCYPSDPGQDESFPDDILLSQLCSLEACTDAAATLDEDEDDHVPEVALGMPVSNWFRAACIKITRHHVFDSFMTFCILLSCVAMTQERPSLQEGSTELKVLNWVNLATTLIFALESGLKIVSFNPLIYWRKHSNKIDALIVLISFLLLAVEDSRISALKSLRVLRALKAMRIATRSEAMKHQVALVVSSLASMVNVAALLLLVIGIFAVLGLQLFSGLFYSCNDATVAGKPECTGTFLNDMGEEVSRIWSRPFYNFDSFGNSLFALFVSATLDGYQPIMQNAIAAPSIKGMQPSSGSHGFSGMFFVAYIVISVFVMLNLFVGMSFFQFSPSRSSPIQGVIFFQFQKLASEENGMAGMDIAQKEWLAIVPYLLSLRYSRFPPRPVHAFRRWCYDVAQSDVFENVILFLVVCNVVEMCIWWRGMDPQLLLIKERINIVISICFGMELLLKVAGLGWKEYWASGWNKLDYVLVSLSIIDLAFSYLKSSFLRIVKVLKAQKLLRLLRMTRMVKALKTLRSILHLLVAIQRSIGALLNIVMLVLVVFFTFAYTGVQLFGGIKRGAYLNYHSNFENFGSAMLTLVRVGTLDAWAELLTDLTVQPPLCDKQLGNCGQSMPVVSLFFGCFVLLVSLLLVNLIVATIIQNFEVLQSEERWAFSPAQIGLLLRIWGHVSDTDGTISQRQLVKVVRSLLPPLGMGPDATNDAIVKMIGDMEVVPVFKHRYTFEHTVFALVANLAEVPLPETEATAVARQKVSRHFSKVYSRLGISRDDRVTVRSVLQSIWSFTWGRCCGLLPQRRLTAASLAQLDDRQHSIFVFGGDNQRHVLR